MNSKNFSQIKNLYTSDRANDSQNHQALIDEIAALPAQPKGNPNKLKDMVKVSREINVVGCAFHLMQWTYRQVYSYGATEILIDLKEFAWQTAKQRHNKKPYAPKTIKEALQKLDARSQGLIQVYKSHNWHLHTIIVRPLSSFKRDTSPNSLPESDASNAKLPSSGDFSKNTDWQQQQLKKTQREEFIIKARRIFNQEMKLKLDERTLRKLSYWANNSIDLIKKGYEWLIARYSTAKKTGENISNAAGYLIQGFRFGWFEDFDPFYEPEIPIVDSMKEIASLSRKLFST